MKIDFGHLTAGLLAWAALLSGSAGAAETSATKPFPRLQVVPLPYQEAGFERDGREIARYHYSPAMRRPFVFPLIGPSGRSLTRMGHPHDAESHSHHYSVWISHNDVNGLSFWDDRSKGKIVHQRIERFEDDGERSYAVTVNHWLNETNDQVLLVERRCTQVQLLPRDEWLLLIDLQLDAKSETVTLGKTPFGMIGARMAKTIGVNDGGGSIRNSEGAEGEPAIFWKPARWVDYSGPVTEQAIEGITLMDHPSNPNHPCGFHVRRDGWMGASLTLNGPLAIEAGKPIRLRYGLYVHAGKPSLEQLQEQWTRFAATQAPELFLKPPKK